MPKARRWLGRMVSFARILILLSIPAVIAGICSLDALYIEPNFPRVIRQDILIDDLPRELEGLKIVHLSDLHIVKQGKREDRAIAKIRRIEPDIICLTGDYVQDDGITPGNISVEESMREFRHFAHRLKAKHGIYAVSGNWDPPTLQKDIAETNVQVIDEDCKTVRMGDAALTICDSEPVLASEVAGRPLIVLDHFPETVDNIARSGRKVDLMLAGHWHGGQVNLPGQTPNTRYLAGLYQVGDIQLYVTRGLGMHTYAIRFRCPSEITLITLRRK
ncbi:MAG: metallophosphoesterase family protein [Armatimonadetes bacterium]|nr:metallophosphoesterase family protein [Armatimonadota bacterium]